MSTQDRGRQATAAPVADVEQLAAHLAALADREIAALLLARPDLSTLPSSSFAALAARAGARPSVEAALADLDAVALGVAEAVVALGTQDATVLAPALGLGQADAAACLARLGRLALVIAAGPVPGLREALGRYPLGLGPQAAELPAELPPSLAELEAAAEGPDPVVSSDALAMLTALTWGPPAGTVRSEGQMPGAAELVERGWLERGSDSTGRTRFVLPREVALALRGGRLTRVPLEPPGQRDLEVLDDDVVGAEAARHAEEAVRLVTALLVEWGREGGPILRSGGVGVRALARTAEALGVESAVAATVVEVAAGAGLLGLDDAGASWVPADTAAAWLAAGTTERWAPLAAAWARSARTPWLVGSRSDDGTLRPVLGADVEAHWARVLRRRILLLLASLPQGTVGTPEWVCSALTFARPRRPVPAGAVSAVLAEAELLGLTGAGALSAGGRVLTEDLKGDERRSEARAAGTASDGDLEGSVPGGPSRDRVTDPPPEDPHLRFARLVGALEDALARDLPAAVDVLLIQSDLTAIVPGRPAPALAELLEGSSVVESRGAALTVRFTPTSVRRALDLGYSPDELTRALAGFSATPLPTTLTVLIDDAARRHGAVRVREAACVLRVPDAAVAAGIVADERLTGLGLVELAPGVVVSPSPAGRVLRELRAAGLSPVLEDAEGGLVLTRDGTGRGRRAGLAPAPTRPGSEHTVRRRRPTARELAVLVGRLRAGEQTGVTAGGSAPATDPVHALAVLRQAQASKARLRLRLAGQDGAVQERGVQVLAVEPGRVRLADLARQTELTVAVHRIVSVEPD